MSFIQRERDRISAKLTAISEDTLEYGKLYAAQQALAWAVEPHGYASPYAMITGTQEGSGGYSAAPASAPRRPGWRQSEDRNGYLAHI